MSTEEKFNAAVNVIKNLPKDGPYQPSNEMALRFYSYFKQATEGPCEQPKPAFWEVIKKVKWEAWRKLGSMSKEEAMNSYIEELKKVTLQIVETMAFTDKVAEFMDNVGPFYEMVDLPLPKKGKSLAYGENDVGLSNGDAKDRLTIFITSKAVDNYKYLGCTLRAGPPVWNEKHCAEIANGLPPDSNGHKPEWDSVEATIEATTTATAREMQTDNFYSGSDSDEEEFSDPVDNDELVDDKTFEIPLAECNGGTEDSGSNEANGDVLAYEVLALKKDGGGIANGPQSLPLQDGMSGKVETNGPIDGAVIRGGGDPMASRSAARTYGSVGHQQAFPQRKGYGDVQLGSSNAGGRPSAAGAGGGQGRRPGGGGKTGDVNEQIAFALVQLQHDMESVLTRLNTLEALTVAHHNMAQGRLVVHGDGHVSSQVEKSNVYSWWPFRNMSLKTVALFLAWPVVLHLIITLISAQRARRLRRKRN